MDSPGISEFQETFPPACAEWDYGSLVARVRIFEL